jgi:hypothetical protein
MTHTDRITSIVSRFEEAMARFEARIAAADPAHAERVPEGGGWTPAQVAAHVAAVNGSFAAIIDGTRPVAQPPAADFVEREWAVIGGGIPEKLEAPSRVHPPASVTRGEAVAALEASSLRMVAALRGREPERAAWTIDSPIVGRVSLYQVGEWGVWHVIRHNKQVKRLLDVA